MKKLLLVLLAMALVPFCAFPVDGVVLINQSTVMVGGGFPYSITQPGSYRLSGNLVVPADTSGILISVDNVTLDLNGFNIQCSVTVSTPTCVGGVDAAHNITVRNGSITGIQLRVTTSGTPFFHAVRFDTGQNTIEDLRVEVPATSYPLFGIYRTISLAPRNVIRRNTLTGAAFMSCPSIIVENNSVGNVLGVAGAGCAGYGNIGFFPLP